ncbi:MAG: carboxymuconolactone decarboxylase family protein [Bacteroidetes bacterium]|nr:carboxymuconolactone decarboxylase family protein [Bacteroidota bacterium]
MSSQIESFNQNRKELNELILSKQNKVINRIFNLDTNAYAAGALSVKTKELLGLVASLVLRCDDCVKYHLQTCFEEGVTEAEVYETLSIGSLVGGTIVIPHLRRAAAFWDELQNSGK